MKDEYFYEFKRKLTDVTDNLSPKLSLKSDRKGGKKFRDYFVFMKMAWTESLSYFAILQSIIIFTALVPNSIENINNFFNWINIDYQLPVAYSSLITILLIFFIFMFGIITYRVFGLARRSYEISALYSPVYLLMYKELQDIKKEL